LEEQKNGFSVLRKERLQLPRCKLQEEERRFFPNGNELIADIQQESEILNQVQNDGM